LQLKPFSLAAGDFIYGQSPVGLSFELNFVRTHVSLIFPTAPSSSCGFLVAVSFPTSAGYTDQIKGAFGPHFL